jgi:hypothetical protein
MRPVQSRLLPQLSRAHRLSVWDCSSSTALAVPSLSAHSFSNACLPCGCFTGGTINNTLVCDATTGQCPCQLQARGRNCSDCQVNFYGLATSTTSSCQACSCSNTGTIATALSECSQSTGQCACKPGATGRTCGGEVSCLTLASCRQCLQSCVQCAAGFFRATGAPVGVCTPCDEDCSSCFGAGANEVRLAALYLGTDLDSIVNPV